MRTSSSQKNALSLSIRDGEGIKHYRIRKLDEGGYFIASRITFRTLQVGVVMGLCFMVGVVMGPCFMVGRVGVVRGGASLL